MCTVQVPEEDDIIPENSKKRKRAEKKLGTIPSALKITKPQIHLYSDAVKNEKSLHQRYASKWVTPEESTCREEPPKGYRVH